MERGTRIVVHGSHGIVVRPETGGGCVAEMQDGEVVSWAAGVPSRWYPWRHGAYRGPEAPSGATAAERVHHKLRMWLANTDQQGIQRLTAWLGEDVTVGDQYTAAVVLHAVARELEAEMRRDTIRVVQDEITSKERKACV